MIGENGVSRKNAVDYGSFLSALGLRAADAGAELLPIGQR